MRRWGIALLILAVVALTALALYFFLPTSTAPLGRGKVDLVRVDKSDRRMDLLSGDQVVHSYRVSLGSNPRGHKQKEGDGRTPEGRYRIDWRNSKSKFYKSLHISYPNAQDRLAARQRGVSPGGNVMIHGTPNGWGWASLLIALWDWTDGCIAVSNQEMDEVWRLVPTDTPIEIVP